jgi:hypothetical protein
LGLDLEETIDPFDLFRRGKIFGEHLGRLPTVAHEVNWNWKMEEL